jgi:hypothetical protein
MKAKKTFSFIFHDFIFRNLFLMIGCFFMSFGLAYSQSKKLIKAPQLSKEKISREASFWGTFRSAPESYE